MTDVKRNIENNLNRLLDVFPVVMLVGARQTGKTTLAKMCRPHWKYFDLENGSDYDFITRDYDFFFSEYPCYCIIDEAQEAPELFRELRGVIDAKRPENGRFILTGSSSPELLERASDSLAGRIAIVEIGTLKMNEIQQQPLPEFYQLFEGDITTASLSYLKQLSCVIDDVLPCFLRGGYPQPVLAADESVHNVWMENGWRTTIVPISIAI